jgi:hypothetical protein
LRFRSVLESPFFSDISPAAASSDLPRVRVYWRRNRGARGGGEE